MISPNCAATFSVSIAVVVDIPDADLLSCARLYRRGVGRSAVVVVSLSRFISEVREHIGDEVAARGSG